MPYEMALRFIKSDFKKEAPVVKGLKGLLMSFSEHSFIGRSSEPVSGTTQGTWGHICEQSQVHPPS